MRAADRLLVDLETENSVISGLYDTLAEMAKAIGVQQLVVGVDDPRCGRQFFSSDRRVFQPSLAFRCGASVWTQPVVVLPAEFELRLVSSAAAAYRRAHQGHPSEGRDAADDHLLPVRAAVARAVRYGLGFTLVCLKAAVPGSAAAGVLRSGDIITQVGDAEFLLILESARDQDVPPILARLAAQGRLPPVTFGLVHCPGDGSEPDDLVGQARLRLADAERDLTVRAVGSGQR
jgi:hypothetical protein